MKWSLICSMRYQRRLPDLMNITHSISPYSLCSSLSSKVWKVSLCYYHLHSVDGGELHWWDGRCHDSDILWGRDYFLYQHTLMIYLLIVLLAYQSTLHHLQLKETQIFHEWTPLLAKARSAFLRKWQQERRSNQQWKHC